MATLIKPFNAAAIDPTQHSAPLPVGNKQLMVIRNSEVRATKNGGNGMLTLYVEIVEGANSGASGSINLNLYHENPTAVAIAEQQLSAICHVIGKLMVAETSALHNIPFRADVSYQRGENPADNPEAKGYTEVKRFYDAAGNEPRKGQMANSAPQQPPQQPQTQAFAQPEAQPQQMQQQPQAPAQTWAAPAAEQPQQQAPQAAPAWTGTPTPAAGQAAPAWATR